MAGEGAQGRGCQDSMPPVQGGEGRGGQGGAGQGTQKRLRSWSGSWRAEGRRWREGYKQGGCWREGRTQGGGAGHCTVGVGRKQGAGGSHAGASMGEWSVACGPRPASMRRGEGAPST